LSKSGDSWVVGGVASNFFKDLDGDAIHPDAIQRAIPGFMANRGPNGLKGGPLRLHHGFWERFLKQAINALHLPFDEQMSLVAAIALPLGRVTEMTVEADGTTRWRGELSQANPIAKVIWGMLKEGLVHLGVSVGGKINATRPGRDALGRPCTLITDVRLDELSITDNPANRLVESEAADNGAYIMALAKAVGAPAPGQMALNFDEQKHKRDNSGKFSATGGAGAATTPHGQGGQGFKFHTENTAYVDARSPEEAQQKLHQHLSSQPHYSKFKIHPPSVEEENVYDDSEHDSDEGGDYKGLHQYKVPFIAKHHVSGNDEGHAIKQMSAHYKQARKGQLIGGGEMTGREHPSKGLAIENEDWKPVYSTKKPVLSKSLKPKGLTMVSSVERFLAKALGPDQSMGSAAAANSGSWGDTSIPEMGRGLQPVKAAKPTGGKTIPMDGSGADSAGSAMGGKQPKAQRPYSSGGMPPTDVWGMTISQMTKELAKCASMKKDAWSSPETIQFLTDSAHGLAGATDNPPAELINLVRFLQTLNRFAQELPHMSDYQAQGTVQAMGTDLTKALDDFTEKISADLKGKALRPPGGPGVHGMDIQFPQQYVLYS
jgi:hypothetical protein